jgi:hypothetical protein
MSGGRFNYVAWGEPVEEAQNRDDYYELLKYLVSFGPKAKEIADELKKDLDTLQNVEREIIAKFQKYRNLLIAAEKEASGDGYSNQVLDELEKV